VNVCLSLDDNLDLLFQKTISNCENNIGIRWQKPDSSHCFGSPTPDH
jgi:hypothetical protein